MCPPCQDTTILSLFQLREVYKQGKFSQIIQSRLCNCLDNTSPRPASTSTSAPASGCSMPRLQEVVPGLQTFTRKSTHSSKMCSQMHHCLSLASQLTPQERARKCTVDFHSQVTSLLLRPIREGSPLWHGSVFVAQSSCSCELDTATRCHTSSIERPLWAGFCFLRGAVSAQILPHGATRPVGQDTLTGCTLLFPILFVAQVPAQSSSSLQPGATLLK